jgi:hypothetical protein
VVLDEVGLGAEPSLRDAEPGGERLLGPQDLPEVRGAPRGDPPARPVPDGVGDPAPEVRERVPRQGHVVQVRRPQPGVLQAPADRADREARVVLDPGEPLLLDGRHEPPVHDQGGRGVAVVHVDPEDVHGGGTVGGCASLQPDLLMDLDGDNRVHAVPTELIPSVLLYVRRRLATPDGYLSDLILPITGRSPNDQERFAARRADHILRRLGVRCLWRAAIVTETLRRRGVRARIQLFVDPANPRKAHAECEVSGEFIQPPPSGLVPLRG